MTLEPAPETNGIPIALAHAETFKVFQHDGFRVVDLSAPIISWGGAAQGQNQTAKIVLVERGAPIPSLTGELSDATVVKTPVERIAVNYGFLEAVLTALGSEDRLVAVGGGKNFNDSIREKVFAGKLAQVGYGWHSPPDLDPLLNSELDVFLMVLGNLDHAAHYERIRSLGVPVVPIFFEAETTYMGPVDYVRLIGMLTGQEAQADQFVAEVESRVEEVKQLVAPLPKKKILSSWYGGSDRWMVTVRNSDNALLEDAGGVNPLAEPDDIAIDDFVRLGTEVLLEKATDIDCWIIRDTHSQPIEDTAFLNHFKAWQDGCIFAGDGMQKPEVDAFDIYETGVIRLDIILMDIAMMLYPELRKTAFTYIRPDTQTGAVNP